MSVFTFRTRSTGRDRETDAQRFNMLSQTFAELLDQVGKEEAGLRRRYEKVRDDAAFALQALDNGGASGVSSRVDELTRSLAQCEARLADLRSQMEFLGDLQGQTSAFIGRMGQA